MSVVPFTIETLIPEEEEIEWVVRWLRSNHSRDPTRTRAENLQQCLKETRKTEGEMDTEMNIETYIGAGTETETETTEIEPPALSNWKKVVDII